MKLVVVQVEARERLDPILGGAGRDFGLSHCVGVFLRRIDQDKNGRYCACVRACLGEGALQNGFYQPTYLLRLLER